MINPQPLTSEEQQLKIKNHLKIAEKVRSGEYFREARSMYDTAVNDPMADRYAYLFITFCSLVVLAIAIIAMDGLYPLQAVAPLVYYTHDLYEDVPHIKPLQTSKSEDPGEVVLRFLVKNYVTQREEYDISTFDRDVNGVKSQTAPAARADFEKMINLNNPESPVKIYQRHSRRKITVSSMRRLDGGMEVLFEAEVDSRTDVKKSRWRANISFQYSGLELDDNSDTVKPMNFVVTAYNSKRLQDVK